MEAIEWTWAKILVADLLIMITILGFIYKWLKNRQDVLDSRFAKHEDKINDLSATCARREEIMAAVNAAVSPINHQVTEIRHRIDDLFSLQKNMKI